MPCCPIPCSCPCFRPSCCPRPSACSCGGCPCPCGRPCPCGCPLQPLSCAPCAPGQGARACPCYWPPLSYTPPTQKIYVVVNNYLPKQESPCHSPPCCPPQHQPQSRSELPHCCPDLGMNPPTGYTDSLCTRSDMNKQGCGC